MTLGLYALFLVYYQHYSFHLGTFFIIHERNHTNENEEQKKTDQK